jgi:hypothetical protein
MAYRRDLHCKWNSGLDEPIKIFPNIFFGWSHFTWAGLRAELTFSMAGLKGLTCQITIFCSYKAFLLQIKIDTFDI